jgi:hypothetical protein
VLSLGHRDRARVPRLDDDARLSPPYFLWNYAAPSPGYRQLQRGRVASAASCQPSSRLTASPHHADSKCQPGGYPARSSARPAGPCHSTRARGVGHARAGVADARRGVRCGARRRPAGADLIPRGDRGRTAGLRPGLRSLRPASSAARRAYAVSRRHSALRVGLVAAGADRRPHARGDGRLRWNGAGPGDRARRLRPRARGERIGDDHDGDELGTLTVTRHRRLSRPVGRVARRFRAARRGRGDCPGPNGGQARRDLCARIRQPRQHDRVLSPAAAIRGVSRFRGRYTSASWFTFLAAAPERLTSHRAPMG